MPVSANAFQGTPPDGFDFYLLVIERGFTGMLYGSYLGGNLAHEHVDGGTSRFDKNGVVYQSVCGGCGGHCAAARQDQIPPRRVRADAGGIHLAATATQR